MRTDAMHGFSARKRAIAIAATIIAVATAGCGAAQSPPAVRLALTAPADGSAVSVSNIKVFGTVDPPSAAVVVAGEHVHVAHGVFGRWIALRAGLSHIKIVASAAGYIPTKLNIAVRSSPGPPPRTSGSEEASSAGAVSTGVVPPTGGGRYTPRVQATLLRACQASAGGRAAATASCRCDLSYLEAHVPQTTLIVWERAFLKGEATLPHWLREAALACRKT
jgi:glucodextranase-like protein